MSWQATEWTVDAPVPTEWTHRVNPYVAWCVLFALSTYADARGAGAHPSHATLAARLRFSERTVRRALHALTSEGLLIAEARPGRPTVYRFNFDPGPLRSEVSDDHPGPLRSEVPRTAPRTGATPPRTEATQTPDRCGPTIQEPPLDPYTRAGELKSSTPASTPEGRAKAQELFRKIRNGEQLAEDDAATAWGGSRPPARPGDGRLRSDDEKAETARRYVLRALDRASGPMRRSELTHSMGAYRVYRDQVLADLEEAGLITVSTTEYQPGRLATWYELTADAPRNHLRVV